MSASPSAPSASSSANSPALGQAASAVLTPEEKQTLKSKLITTQIEQATYLRTHPEISQALQLAMSALVKSQPDDAIGFLTEFLGSDNLPDLVSLAQATDENVKWELAQRHKSSEAPQQ